MLVRGNPGDGISPGFYIFNSQPEGYSLNLDSSAYVVVSGVALSSSFGVKQDGTCTVLQSAESDPFVEWSGGVQPGSTATLGVTGPAGEPALVILSPTVGSGHAGGVDGLIWIGGPPQLVLPIVTTGAPLPFSGELPADAGLLGLALWAQAYFPGLPGALTPGKAFLTNADALLIRL